MAVADAIESVYRNEWSGLLATLTRYVGGDLGLAEDALQEAFAAAAAQWVDTGIPDQPSAWLTVTARRRAIDRIRSTAADRNRIRTHAARDALVHEDPDVDDDPEVVSDDQLRLVYLCCHPSLSLEARLALTLRSVGGLEVTQIARGFLVPDATIHQRLHRAKRKIVDAGIAFRLPDPEHLPTRTADVLRVIYLIFNEGHVATRGPDLVDVSLCAEAIRLAHLVVELLPDDPEAAGLLSLLLLTDSRRAARLDASGVPVSLEDQDRTAWDRDQIESATALLDAAIARRSPGPFQIQAAIAALHAEAASFADTDWRQIVLLYERLLGIAHSPVVAVNHAIAVAQIDGPSRALALLDAIAETGALGAYQPLHAARAEMLAATGDRGAASVAYRRAAALLDNDAARVGLQRRAATHAVDLGDDLET